MYIGPFIKVPFYNIDFTYNDKFGVVTVVLKSGREINLEVVSESDNFSKEFVEWTIKNDIQRTSKLP